MLLKYLSLPAIWAALIFYLCVREPSGFKKLSFLELIPAFDKIVHFGFYLVLAALLIYGFRKQFTSEKLRSYAAPAAVLFCALYGAVIEVLQATVFTYRSASWWDELANITGALAGYYLLKTTYPKLGLT